MKTYEYERKTFSLDIEGKAAWERLSKNWIMSHLLNNFLISFERNFSKYQRYIDLDLLPADIFNRITDGDLEWIEWFKHFKSIAWKKSNDNKN